MRAPRPRPILALAAVAATGGCALVLALDPLEYDAPPASDASTDETPRASVDAGALDAAALDADGSPSPSFADPTRWSAFNDLSWAGALIPGAFDGVYVYFVRTPADKSNQPRVVRLDTTRDFADASSWERSDPQFAKDDVGASYAVSFDGRYLLLAGYRKYDAGITLSSYVLRLDTKRPEAFTTSDVWDMTDLKELVPAAPRLGQYMGGAWADGSTYFSSQSASNSYVRHEGEALDAGWTAYLPEAGCPAVGAACAGPYVYFGMTVSSDCVQRYDTRRGLTDPTAWESFATTAAHSAAGAFNGTISTPDHVYFTQMDKPSSADASFDGHYRIVRHAPGHALDAGWESFEVDQVHSLATGAQAGAFDGRYVYFAPIPRKLAGVNPGTVFLRYDTTLPFDSTDAWEAAPGQNIQIGSTAHRGAIFDGQYVYFTPQDSNSPVVRYRATDLKRAVPPTCSRF